MPHHKSINLLTNDCCHCECYTNLHLKQDKIQERSVILLIVSKVNEQIVSQRRFTTCSKVAKTSFLKPILRISFHIRSIGFISGGKIRALSPLEICLCLSARLRACLLSRLLDFSTRSSLTRTEMVFPMSLRRE